MKTNNFLDETIYVEKQNKQNCSIFHIKIGQKIKTTNEEFTPIIKNKFQFSYISKNYFYTKVEKIIQNKQKLIFQFSTETGKKIRTSLDTKFVVMKLSNLMKTQTKYLYQILDIHSWNQNPYNKFEQYYRLVTEDGIQNINYDSVIPLGRYVTTSLYTENGKFFANGFLISNS